jgi:predicted RNA-binding protein
MIDSRGAAMHYLIVVNDIQHGGKVAKAEEIWEFLVSRGVWIFPEHAPHVKKLQRDNRLIFYMAGKQGGGVFVGEATIASDVTPLEGRLKGEVQGLGLTWFTRVVELKTLKRFDPPRPIRPLIAKLTFIKDKKNYGLSLRQGVRRLAVRDAAMIEGEKTRPIRP